MLAPLIALDINAYVPIASTLVLALWGVYTLIKRGRKGQKDDILAAVEEEAVKLNRAMAVLQSTNLSLEQQARLYKQERDEAIKAREECYINCEKVERFNLRLQGRVDELERRFNENAVDDSHSSKPPNRQW